MISLLSSRDPNGYQYSTDSVGGGKSAVTEAEKPLKRQLTFKSLSAILILSLTFPEDLHKLGYDSHSPSQSEGIPQIPIFAQFPAVSGIRTEIRQTQAYVGLERCV